MPKFRHVYLLAFVIGSLWNPLQLAAQVLKQETCAGQSVSFPTRVFTSLGGIVRWDWNFGDPTSGPANRSDSREPTHRFQQPGTYIVSLIISTDRGITDTIRTEVVVHPKPQVSLVLLDSCGTDSLRLKALGLLPDTRMRWYADDRLLSDTSEVAMVPLTTKRLHTISLNVIDSHGCRATAQRVIRSPLVPPIPYTQNDTVCFGEAATLIGHATEGSILRWMQETASSGWQQVGIGDTIRTPPLSFSQPYVAVAIDTTTGCESQRASAHVYVHQEEEVSVQHRILNPERVPAQVAFKVKSSVEPLAYYWDFDDDSGSQEATPTHTFMRPRTYQVSAVLTYKGDCDVTLYERVNITAPPALTLPSAFSPNDDGINDVFRADHASLKELHLRIFDRRGQLVYETRNPKFAWDGRGFSGRLVSQGVYICVIEGRDLSGTVVKQKKNLTIIR